MLCPIEINNNNEFSLDDTSLEVTDLLESHEKLPRENLEAEIPRYDSCVDGVRSSSKKRGRPKVVSMTENLSRERRDAANARERKRMNQMTRYCNKVKYGLGSKRFSSRAYKTLRSRLPNNEKVVSKKQIVDQVRQGLLILCLSYSKGKYSGFAIHQRVEIPDRFLTKR